MVKIGVHLPSFTEVIVELKPEYRF